jgi:hypothetical protein
MVSMENDSVLEDFVKRQKRTPQPRHVRSKGQVTYLSQSDFGTLQ